MAFILKGVGSGVVINLWDMLAEKVGSESWQLLSVPWEEIEHTSKSHTRSGWDEEMSVAVTPNSAESEQDVQTDQPVR